MHVNACEFLLLNCSSLLLPMLITHTHHPYIRWQHVAVAVWLKRPLTWKDMRSEHRWTGHEEDWLKCWLVSFQSFYWLRQCDACRSLPVDKSMAEFLSQSNHGANWLLLWLQGSSLTQNWLFLPLMHKCFDCYNVTCLFSSVTGCRSIVGLLRD